MKNYIFKSERLGFRTWIESDIDKMSDINGDKKVMEFFPAIQSKDHTAKFIKKMNEEFSEKQYCYFAVDILQTDEFIGFIGMHYQDFESDYTPNVDIGWRLSEEYWNKGYATEGAKRCLDYAFNTLNLDKVISLTPSINLNSEKVMQKIGMKKVSNFEFVLLKNDERLKDCVLYEIENVV